MGSGQIEKLGRNPKEKYKYMNHFCYLPNDLLLTLNRHPYLSLRRVQLYFPFQTKVIHVLQLFIDKFEFKFFLTLYDILLT